MTRNLESKQFTTYREKNSKTLNLKKELENSSSSNEKEQSSKKDSVFENTRFVDKEIEQLITKILQVTIEEQDYEVVTKRVVFFVNTRTQFMIENVVNNVV